MHGVDKQNLLLWNIHRHLILQYNCKVQISKALLLRYKQYMCSVARDKVLLCYQHTVQNI